MNYKTKPTKETLKLKEGDQFNMGQTRMTVTTTATFSGELHYGFTYCDVSGLIGCGWMPVVLVESYTGFAEAGKAVAA